MMNFIIKAIASITVLILAHGLQAENRRITITPKTKNWTSVFSSEINKQIASDKQRDTLFVDFAEGNYSLHESIRFSNANPNRNTAPVVIKGLGDVTFSGGNTLINNQFKPISDASVRERIICAKTQKLVLEYDLLKYGITDLGEIKCIGFSRVAGATPVELFHNNERMTLARYPNAGNPYLLKERTSVIPIFKITNSGIAKVELPLDNSPVVPVQGNTGAFEYTDARAKRWINAADVWLDGVFARDWAWSLNKVSKIDTVRKTISLKYEEKYDLTATHSFFFATNLLEEIDVPGEYFIDRTRGKLYFYPPTGFNEKSSVIKLSGNDKDFLELKGINNWTVENINFEMGRYRAVNLNQCNDIVFRNCGFRNFGNSAIAINGDNNRIENCTIKSIGGTAITLEGGNSTTLTKSNNTVIACDISDWAYYNRVYTPAIKLGGVGCNVIGNRIYFAPHGAITFTGNDHLIERNEISNVLLEFRDFGAVYAFIGRDQLMRGHIIRQNYFHNIGSVGEGVHVIYADEASSGWTIENNLFYKIGNKNARVSAIMSNSSSYLNINNNLFLDCSETFELSLHFATWGKKRYTDSFKKHWEKQYGQENSINEVYLKRYPELKTLNSEDKVYVSTNSFTNNTVGNFTIPLTHKGIYLVKGDKPNLDSLVQASGNVWTEDKNLPEFLDRWNNAGNRKYLENTMPELLRNYLIYR
jgi:hypothetical protein